MRKNRSPIDVHLLGSSQELLKRSFRREPFPGSSLSLLNELNGSLGGTTTYARRNRTESFFATCPQQVASNGEQAIVGCRIGRGNCLRTVPCQRTSESFVQQCGKPAA